MTKNTWCPGIWVVALGLLAALGACAPAANAQLGGDTLTITAYLHGGPFKADITVGPGVELEANGSPTLGGYPGTGESVDCDNFQCIFTFAPPGLQGAFELSGLDSMVKQDLLGMTIGGNMVASSRSHVSIDNKGASSLARFTVDCNGFMAVNPCRGGMVVVTFDFAPVGGGDPLQALNDLKDAVIALSFSEEEEEEEEAEEAEDDEDEEEDEEDEVKEELIDILEEAIEELEDDEPDDAIEELSDFIDEVEEFMEEQEIGAIGDALIAVAQEIIELLQAA